MDYCGYFFTYFSPYCASLEEAEKLEQLRFIENGFTIQASIYNAEIPSGIDTPEDLQSAINFIKNAINKNATLINSLAIKSIAKYLITIESEQCLDELYLFLINHNDKVLVLGEGSNVVLPDYFDGIVIKTNLNDIAMLTDSKVTVGSSFNWSSFVNWSLDNNFHGLENLSLIPGSVGASPIQNIGAYGVELKDVFVSCAFL